MAGRGRDDLLLGERVSTDLAYLAGFLDGEGSIQIARGHWKNFPRGYTLHVSAKQVDPAPLRMLAERFGGRVIPVVSPQPNRLPYYRWGIVGRVAAAALRSVLPYLVVKHGQAELAVAYQSSIDPRRGGRPVSEWEYAERDAWAEALREVKHMDFH